MGTRASALLAAALSGVGQSVPTALRVAQRMLPSSGVLRTRGRWPGSARSQPDPGDPQDITLGGPSGALPPALLTTPGYYGTLAAVRSLGRHGIPVTTGGPSPWVISGWSKYASTHVDCPATTESERFIAWLLEFGRQNERHVLLPTCDDSAWLYARHRDRLSQYFHLSSARIGTIHSLLHKGHLARHAQEAGLDVPRSWFPQSEADIAQVIREARFPVLLKPVTQVLFCSRNKGERVDHPDGLRAAFARVATLGHGKELVDYDVSAARWMVQEFFPNASANIYNISSYAQDGKLWGARAGCKILQVPRRIGVGVCFEEAAVDPLLVAKLERLVQLTGFSGVFEAEFIQAENCRILIDFNPRFYNQMGFDVARGLPLPTLAYFGAFRQDKLPARTYQANDEAEDSAKVFAYGSAFKVMVASQRLSGAFTAQEAARWVSWYESHEGRRVDAVSDPDDAWPARLDKLQMLYRHLRHPRDFLRSVALNR